MAEDWDHHHSALSAAAYRNPALRWRWRHILRLLDLTRSANVTVLDVGCGEGQFAAFLKARHPNAAIVGIDGSEVGIAAAARLVPDGRFHCTDLQRPDPRLVSALAGTAAAAVCTEVLEHLDRPVDCLSAVKGWLAPGGRVVITVPAGPMSASDRHFGHRKHYTRQTLLDEIERAGLTAEGAWAAGFPFHTLYRLAALAYGGRAVDCQTGRAGGAENALVAAAYRGFDALFRLNLFDSPLGGWQLFARVRRDA